MTKLKTFTEIYRPPKFDGIIDKNGNVIKIIDVRDNIPKIQKIIKNKIKQNFLLVGPQGSGKTTTAWAIARAFVESNLSPAAKLMGSSVDSYIEYINASKAGIDTVRSLIEPLVSISGVNVMILDEFDGITMKAQHALRSDIEKAEQMVSPKLFILTANYVNKIIDPIISRCGAEAFMFPKIPFKFMLPTLKQICKIEKIAEFIFPPDIIDKAKRKEAFDQYWKALYDMIDGDMRRALKYLEKNIEIDDAGRKTLDMTSEPIDLTTNAYYLQLDEILLADSETDYSNFVNSIDEMIYRREGNTWESSTFFKETFKWLKQRADRFNNKVIYDLAEIVAEYEFRVGGGNVELQSHLTVMISVMRKTLLKDDLEQRQLSELSKLIKEAKELTMVLKS